MAIAGENFAVVGTDTRLSHSYNIHTRYQQKTFNLNKSAVLATAGCWPDALAFMRVMNAQLFNYKAIHNKEMTAEAIAQLISILMYERRFFPYYLSNIVVGIDSQGKGCVYSYDPIGHCERAVCRAGGSSGALLQPLLDNQVLLKNQPKADGKNVTVEEALKELTVEKAIELIKDCFTSAAERDIKTGDDIDITILIAGQEPRIEKHHTRRD